MTMVLVMVSVWMVDWRVGNSLTLWQTYLFVMTKHRNTFHLNLEPKQ